MHAWVLGFGKNQETLQRGCLVSASDEPRCLERVQMLPLTRFLLS